MPYASVETVALGDTNIFVVPFPYLKRPDVHAYVDEAEVAGVVWLNASIIRLPGAAAELAGKRVRVQRITPNQTAAVTFKPGGLDHGDLNTSVLQLLYVSQEAADRLAALPTPLPGNRYDFKGNRAVNVGDPRDAQDATTLGWVNSRVAVMLGEAAVDELFHTTSAAFRALMVGYLRTLPVTEPASQAVPWLNGGLLAVTDGEPPPPTDEQATFNATFGPMFVAYLRQRPAVEPAGSGTVWLNGGFLTLSN